MGEFKALRELEKIVLKLKKDGKTIVTTNGCFDLLHVGHIRHLKESKEQGDVLIVGINSDSSVKQNKGNERPINKEQDRAEILTSLIYVDYVTIFKEPDCRRFVDIIKPDVHTNSIGYGMNCLESEIVNKNGGRIYLTKNYPEFSTTSLIKKIKNAYKK